MKLADAKLLSFAAMLCAVDRGDSVGHALAVLHGRGYLARTVFSGTVSHGRVAVAHFYDSADSTVEQPMHQIMYDRGANLFRLRVFVNPQTNYTGSNVGAIQSTAYDIALAQQIKADCPNAKIVLDFHYSDTWADPGHQSKPQNLAGSDPGTDWRGFDLPTLNTTVRNYTRDTLTAFQSAG